MRWNSSVNEQQPNTESSPARTILVVEDDEVTRSFEEELLLLDGYTVLSAASGAAALAHIAAAPIAVILVDYRLPDIDGVTLCRRLREQVGQDVPIILVTADRGPGLEGVARDAGATGFLLKPFLPLDLLDQIARPT